MNCHKSLVQVMAWCLRGNKIQARASDNVDKIYAAQMTSLVAPFANMDYPFMCFFVILPQVREGPTYSI